MENTMISGTRPSAYGHGRFDSRLAPCAGASTLEVAKLVLSTLPPPPPYTNSQRWRDADSAAERLCQHEQREYDRLARTELALQPCTPSSGRPSEDVDDVPLGHFVSTQAFWEQEDDNDTSCADEAPPSYAVAVGQSDGDGLMQHLLGGHRGYGEMGADTDLEMQGRWEERYAVVKIVAMFAVAIILFGISVVLGCMVLGGILE